MFVRFKPVTSPDKETVPDMNPPAGDRSILGPVRQIVSAFLLSCTGLFYGMTFTYTAVAAPSWMDDDQVPFELSHHDIGLHASTLNLGALLGSLIGGLLVTLIGPKKVVLAAHLPYLASWILVTFPVSKLMLFTGRFLSGVSVDVLLFAAMIYVDDFMSKSLRSRLTPLSIVLFNVGSILTYVFGMLIDWKTLGIVNAFLPVPLFLCCLYLPDGPSHLLQKKSEEEALASLSWFRGPVSPSKLLDELARRKAEFNRCRKQNENAISGIRSLMSKEFLKPIGIALICVILRMWSGASSIVAFTVNIFQSSGSSVNPYVASLVISVVLLMSQLLSSSLEDKVGKRRFVITSVILCGISQTIFGCYYLLKNTSGHEEIIEKLGVLPIICLITMMFAYGLGLHHLQFSIPLEILPAKIRTKGVALTQFFSSLSCFLMLNFFYDMTDSPIGFHGTFWIYAISCFLLTITIIKLVPEIRNHKSKSTNIPTVLSTMPLISTRDGDLVSLALVGQFEAHAKGGVSIISAPQSSCKYQDEASEILIHDSPPYSTRNSDSSDPYSTQHSDSSDPYSTQRSDLTDCSDDVFHKVPSLQDVFVDLEQRAERPHSQDISTKDRDVILEFEVPNGNLSECMQFDRFEVVNTNEFLPEVPCQIFGNSSISVMNDSPQDLLGSAAEKILNSSPLLDMTAHLSDHAFDSAALGAQQCDYTFHSPQNQNISEERQAFSEPLLLVQQTSSENGTASGFSESHVPHNVDMV